MERPDPTLSVARYRKRLQAAVSLVVVMATGSALYFMQHRLAAEVEMGFQREFRGTFRSLRAVHEMRHTELLARCRELIQKLRIEARPGEDLVKLLYPGTRRVLQGILEEEGRVRPGDGREEVFHAEFYRFLDGNGAVIEPPTPALAGKLSPHETAQLALPGPVRGKQQLGYMVREEDDEDGPLHDLVAIPVFAPGGARGIATLVLGFESADRVVDRSASGALTGVWAGGQFFLPELGAGDRQAVASAVSEAIKTGGEPAQPPTCTVGGGPHLLLFQQLNPGSAYPAAYEVGLYSLAESRSVGRSLRWQVLGAGAIFLLVGLAASHLVAVRFSAPVEHLAQTSAEHLARRRHAEVALTEAAEGLRRAERFSADASHQLKTPVAVLRVALEELRAQTDLPPGVLTGMIDQTDRLSGLIESLLLLSRLDAGRLRIESAETDLTQLAAAALDDRGALPDPLGLVVEADLPTGLAVSGDRRYLAHILQNLVENAGKYNRPGGRIRMTAWQRDGWVGLCVANTAPHPIPQAEWEHIFDRFHRGGVGEDIPGYGLGLNLARQLARLHDGELSLVRSDVEWTEFELRLRAHGRA